MRYGYFFVDAAHEILQLLFVLGSEVYVTTVY